MTYCLLETAQKHTHVHERPKRHTSNSQSTSVMSDREARTTASTSSAVFLANLGLCSTRHVSTSEASWRWLLSYCVSCAIRPITCTREVLCVQAFGVHMLVNNTVKRLSS